MQIVTERLTLREFRQDDWPAMAAYWSDPRYQRYYALVPDVERAVRDLVGRFVAAQSEEPRRMWQLAIVRREDERLLGNCGVRVNDPELAEGNVGYELDPRWWGRGYATEAARAMLDYGFNDLRLHRIWAECVADNAASAHVLEKLGMRQEARFREHRWFRGRWWDTLIYAILDRQWRSSPSRQT